MGCNRAKPPVLLDDCMDVKDRRGKSLLVALKTAARLTSTSIWLKHFANQEITYELLCRCKSNLMFGWAYYKLLSILIIMDNISKARNL